MFFIEKCFFSSKLDETTEVEGLCFLQPQHEYFHQYMVLADCENELFRDGSRGLEGGSFFLATLLNRKDARTKKGKDAIDALEEFFLLKADARFCHYFLRKFELNPCVDNTPPGLKNGSPAQKSKYLHELVVSALHDLLAYFRTAQNVDPLLLDFPVEDGRRKSTEVFLTLKSPAYIKD